MNGWTDVPADLSDVARIARLAAFLPDEAVVVSSDLARAIATADAICGPRARLPHDRSLREIHFGAWEARTFAEVEADDPALLRRYLEEPGETAPPGGESWNDLRNRVNAAVDGLTGAAGHIVAVAHFGTILTQIQRATGCTPYDALAHDVHPLSVTRIEIDGAWRAAAINHCP